MEIGNAAIAPLEHLRWEQNIGVLYQSRKFVPIAFVAKKTVPLNYENEATSRLEKRFRFIVN